MLIKPQHPVAVLRKQYGLSQVSLAELMQDVPGYAKGTIEDWESGRRNCSDKKLQFLIKYLKERSL